MKLRTILFRSRARLFGVHQGGDYASSACIRVNHFVFLKVVCRYAWSLICQLICLFNSKKRRHLITT